MDEVMKYTGIREAKTKEEKKNLLIQQKEDDRVLPAAAVLVDYHIMCVCSAVSKRQVETTR